MALVWRLIRPAFASALDGKGNIERGARWNSPGQGVVHASFNLSLCVLESLVQLSPPQRFNLPEMAAVEIELPAEASVRELTPGEWQNVAEDKADAAHRCREIGDAWLAAKEHLILIAPSFVVPQECNVMLNPAHPLMRRVKIISTELFKFDSRLALSR
jgi:RES domain-containing protein